MGHVMKREKLDYLVTPGMIVGKRKEKQILDGLTKSLNEEQITDALKATKDRYEWKVMIPYAKE